MKFSIEAEGTEGKMHNSTLCERFRNCQVCKTSQHCESAEQAHGMDIFKNPEQTTWGTEGACI